MYHGVREILQDKFNWAAQEAENRLNEVIVCADRVKNSQIQNLGEIPRDKQVELGVNLLDLGGAIEAAWEALVRLGAISAIKQRLLEAVYKPEANLCNNSEKDGGPPKHDDLARSS